MTNEQFDKILKRRLQLTKDVLSCKAKEYAVGDRLSNFNYAATMTRTSRRAALLGMMAKHLVSVVDMIHSEDRVFSGEYIEEKIGDSINYFILLEAMLKEDFGCVNPK